VPSAILTTAQIAYRSFPALSIEEQDAVLQVLADSLPDDAAEIAQARLYHLRQGGKAQLQLDAILRELDPKARQLQLPPPVGAVAPQVDA